MINVNQITAQMARMPDAALQRYAQMNKSDPYIVSLALSESNRRKELRTGAQMNAPQQPKVVDQELQGMAQPMPENTGIGQLPAQNLQGMAGGGIVAFDEGGEVPRYQSQGLVQMPTATSPYAIPGFARSPDAALLGMPQTGSPDKTPFFQRLFSEAEEEGRKYKIGQAQARIAQGNGTKADYELVNASIIAATAPKQPAAPTAPTAPSVDKTGTAAAAKTDAAAKADTGAAPAGAGGDKSGLYALTQPAFAPGQGLGLGTSPTTYASELEAMQPQGEVKSPFEAGIRAVGDKATQAAREYKELREQQMKDAGLAGIEQEKRLQVREEKLGKAEGDNAGLALLKAGFAMMAGTSQHGLVNIGAGANVGMEDYVKGRDKIDAARERLDDAFDRLAQVRRGELMMNQKEQAQLQKDVNNAITQTERDVLAGAQQAYGWKKEDARAAFNAYVADRRTGAELTSRERLGLAGIASQENIAGKRNQLMQDMYGGDAKATAEFGKIQKQVMSDLAKNPMYANEPNEAKKTAMYNTELNRAIQANPFLSARTAGLGFQKAPTGPVRDLIGSTE